MANYKYTLEKYSGKGSRYICPLCKKSEKTFTRYIDTETGQHVHETVGRCNREIECGYHYKPKQYFDDNRLHQQQPNQIPNQYKREINIRRTNYIPVVIFKKSLVQYGRNNFAGYMNKLFRERITSEVIEKYHIGTSCFWENATVFWQVDRVGHVRTGKIMLYDKESGKRVKKPVNHITWVHKVLEYDTYELKQCLFGEHLLATDQNKTVAIVESEKTAVICSIYFPEYIWLATGGLLNLSEEKLFVLKNRKVKLFPDLKAFDVWQEKVNLLSNCSISDYLERECTPAQREQGADLADYITQINYNDYLKQKPIDI